MFKFRDSQFAAFRKQKIAELLLQQLSSAGQQGWLDPATGEVLAKDARGNVRRFGLDEQGFVRSITSPLGRQWLLYSDPEGRLTRLWGPSGFTVDLDYTPQGRPAGVREQGRLRLQLAYDEQGNPGRLLHSDKTTTEFRWLAPGLPLQVKDRLGHSTHFEYDSEDRLRALVDAEGRRTQFAFNAAERSTAILYPDGTDQRVLQLPGEQALRVFSGGEPLAVVERDAQGRPLLIRYADGETLSFKYDKAGRVLSARNQEGEVSFEYNDKGLPTLECFQGRRILHEYEAGGLVSALVLPTGERLEYEHDADLRLRSVVDWNKERYRFEHVGAEQLLRVHAPNGWVTSVHRTQAGHVQRIQIGHAYSPAALFQRTYTQDEQGRVVRIEDPNRTNTYAYDVESQLLGVESTDPAFREGFRYDKVGNRVESNGQRAEFGAAHQLLRQGEGTCRHDKRGNLIALEDSRGAWAFEYNSRDLLTRVRGPNGLEVTFGYDALGRRVWKRCGERLVRYLWVGEHLLREERLEGQRSSTTDYLYLPGTYTPLAMRVDGRTYTFHTDHLGAPLCVTNCVGQKVWSAAYKGFGRAQVEGRVAQPLRLPGQYEDEETGLCYNRFRYYHPDLGRYLTRDPLGLVGGPNLYLYAHNDPLNNTDPLGLLSWKGALSVLAGVAAAAAVVVLAPVSAPLLAVAGVAMAVGAAVGFGLNRALEGGAFCLSCFLQGALEGLIFAGAALLVLASLPATAAAIVGGALMVVGTVGLVSLAASWSDMSTEEKDHALGGLFTSSLLGLRGLRGFRRPPNNGLRRDANGRLRDSRGRFVRDPDRPVTQPKPSQPQTPPKKGETQATRSGRDHHADRKEQRRSSGDWDEVDTTMKYDDGKTIEVPKRVNLRTGLPRGSKVMTTKPDAVSYKRGQILDDKPMGRPISKDRQQIIRYIKAYEAKTGSPPKQILIERYDPVTGQPVVTEIHSPGSFLP